MNDLLKVLDMSEEEQFQWLIEKGITDGSLARSQVTHKIVSRWIRIEFADLAFKLRDEVAGDMMWEGSFHIVYCHIFNTRTNYEIDHKIIYEYFAVKAKPIHWIIAALIAKEDK